MKIRGNVTPNPKPVTVGTEMLAGKPRGVSINAEISCSGAHSEWRKYFLAAPIQTMLKQTDHPRKMVLAILNISSQPRMTVLACRNRLGLFSQHNCARNHS